MVAWEEPGGWPPSFLILTSAVGAKRRPTPPWQASCNLPSLVLPKLRPPVWGFALLSLHGTHWLNSKTMGSRGVTLPSSSEVSGNPLRKDATTGPSSGGSSRSEPLPVAPSSLDPVFGPVGQLGAGGSSNCTWWHLLFCSSLLCPWQSLLLDLALISEWPQVQLNLSISSSRVATMASAFWWASQTVARLFSTKLSLFPFWGMPLLEEWGSSGWGLAVAVDAFPPSTLGGL